MRRIFLYTDRNIPNYIDDNSYYLNRLGEKGLAGKYVHSNYLYWILINNNLQNIFLLDDSNSNTHAEDIILFHYDFKDQVERLNGIKIQVVSDRPRVDFADYFLVNFKKNKNDFLLYEPLPLGLTAKKACWPPVHFHSNLASHHMCKEYDQIMKVFPNIKVTFENDLLVTPYDFDVFFFLRNYDYLNNTQSNLLKQIDQTCSKHANRLLQSWIMEVPCVLTYEKSMQYFLESEFDLIPANSIGDIIYGFHMLIDNEEYFLKMVENAKKRKQMISNTLLVNQINSLREFFN